MATKLKKCKTLPTQIRGESGMVYRNIARCRVKTSEIDTEHAVSTASVGVRVETGDSLFYTANSPSGRVFIKASKQRSTELKFYKYLESRNALHPMLMSLEDVILHEGTTHLVFPFMPFEESGKKSKTLAQFIRTTPFGNSKEDYCMILSIGIAVAEFLEFMNANDAIDLDLKPGNILLCPYDPVHGLRKFDFEGAKIGKRDSTDRLYVKLRKTDLVMYTPLYSPPEILAPEIVLTPFADVYSLGCILYEMFNGARNQTKQENFGDDLFETLDFRSLIFRAYATKDYSPLKEYDILTPPDVEKAKGIPKDLKPIIAKCVGVFHAERYTPSELKEELVRMLEKYISS